MRLNFSSPSAYLCINTARARRNVQHAKSQDTKKVRSGLSQHSILSRRNPRCSPRCLSSAGSADRFTTSCVSVAHVRVAARLIVCGRVFVAFRQLSSCAMFVLPRRDLCRLCWRLANSIFITFSDDSQHGCANIALRRESMLKPMSRAFAKNPQYSC